MANTTNLDLVKPAGTDHALISVLNSNSDKIDAFAGQTKDDIETLEEGLAYIVGNTNTTGETLAAGKFVYVKGHSTIHNGLRKVTASISNNASITTSNTSPDTEGGLNTLKGDLSKHNMETILSATATSSENSHRFNSPLTNYKFLALTVENANVVVSSVIFDPSTTEKIFIPNLVVSESGTPRFFSASLSSDKQTLTYIITGGSWSIKLIVLERV